MSLEGGEMNRSGKLSHFDGSGQAHMVDVGDKPETHRVARAGGMIRMASSTLKLIVAGGAEKGDVLGVARVAAIQAAKRTAELIPLDRKSTRLNSSHMSISYAVFCLKKKNKRIQAPVSNSTPRSQGGQRASE